MGQCQTKVAPTCEDADDSRRYSHAAHPMIRRKTIFPSSSEQSLRAVEPSRSQKKSRADSYAPAQKASVANEVEQTSCDSAVECSTDSQSAADYQVPPREDSVHLHPLIKRLDEQTFAVDKYSTIFNTSPDSVIVADTNGIILECNPSMLETFRYRSEEIIGKPLITIIPWRLRAAHETGFNRFLKTGIPKIVGARQATEVAALRKDGTEFPVELTVASVFRAGSQVLCAFIRDVSQRKEADAARMDAVHRQQAGSELYTSVLQNSPDSIVVINADSIIMDCNPSFCSLFEYDRMELIGQNIKIIIPHKYRDMHDAGIERYCATNVPRLVGVRHGVEISGLKKGDREFPISLTISAVKTTTGKPTFCGFIRDMTARNEAENAKLAAIARANEQKLLFSAVVEHTPDAIVMIDCKGTILHCNPSFCDVLGYASDEAVGKNIRIIIPPRFHAAHDAGLQRYIDTGVPRLVGLRQGVEVAAIRKNGEEFPVELSLSTTERAGGERIFCGFIRDISVRKEAEKQRLLAVEREKAELLLQNMLPRPISDRLKRGEFPIADSFQSASILFLDVCGFTAMSSQMRPSNLVHVLNEIFSAFDELLGQHPAVEKIKTIGDCIMVSCGCPDANTLHPVLMAEFALDLLQLCTTSLQQKVSGKIPIQALRVRIGAHCGAVTAAVIGQKKLQWDVFGDTCNLASRMESSSEPDKINISDAMYQELERLRPGMYQFEERPSSWIKGKGQMKSWFLVGRSVSNHTRPGADTDFCFDM